MGRFRWRSGHKIEGVTRGARPAPPSAPDGELVSSRRGGLRGSVVAVAFTVLVLTGLAAGGAIGTAAALVGHSAASLKAHVSKLEVRQSPSIRTTSAAISQYGQPSSCAQCDQTMAATRQTIDATRTLADRITNPVAKAAVLTALTQADALDAQSTALVTQAAKTTNPTVKAKLLQAALVAAKAANSLAALAHSFALATLKAEGR